MGIIRIAVVDDLPEDRRLIKDFLSMAGEQFDFFDASSVAEGVRLRMLPDGKPPDAMVLDLNLIGGSGLEVLRGLAGETGSMPFPVIVLTADTEWDPASALELGAQDFICKTELTPAGLARVVRNSLTRFRLETAARLSELRFRSVVSDAPIPIIVHSLDGRILELSHAFTKLTGYTREDIPTGIDWLVKAYDLDYPSAEQLHRELETQWLKAGEENRQEKTIRTKFGGERCWLFFGSRPRQSSDGTSIMVTMALDITDRRETERDLQNRVKSLELINALSHEVARAKALPDIYAAAMRVVVEAAGSDRASLLLLDEEGVMRFQAWVGLSETYRRAVDGHSPWNRDQKNIRPILIEDCLQEPSLANLREVFSREGIRGLAFIPLVYEDRLLGKFMLYFNAPHRISEDALRLVQTAANQVTVAIERKLSEQALKRSESKYRELVESLDGVVFERNGESGGFTFLSPKVTAILGYSHSDFQGDGSMWLSRVVHPEDRSNLAELFQSCSERLTGYEVEYRAFHHDGRRLWLREIGSPVEDEKREFSGFRGIMLDITRHKESEESLRESEERLRQVVMLSPNPMVVYAEDGEILHMSRMWSELTGHESHEAPMLQDWLRCNLGETWEARWQEVQNASATGATLEGAEIEVRTRAGELRNWILSDAPLGTLPDGRRLRSSVAMDITERKKSEAKLKAILLRLQETHALLDTLFENAPVGLGFWDSQLRFARVNHALSDITGLPASAHLGRTVSELFPHVDARIANDLRKVFESGQAIVGREVGGETPAAPGRKRHFLLSYYPVRLEGKIAGVGAVCEDITERRETETALKESEEKLRHSQKMEAIGRLAGGVAHDFNNLLTAINGYSDLGLDMIEKNHPVRENLLEIHKAGERAAALTRQLLAYSRKQLLTPRVLQINQVLQGMETMLRRLIGEDIVLKLNLAPNLGPVKADPAQIEQIILNLAINARDAMPRGGDLTIETREVELDEVYSHYLLQVQPGSHIRIEVADTGMGMSPEVRERIFDPFFTTKEQGKGTGLGLSSVYGSVEQSGGNITVESDLGKGTRFDIYLPVVRDEENPDRETTSFPLAFFQSGHGTLLLVEDEDAVRGFIRKVLELKGYRILEAVNARQALEISLGQSIDLLLTDVVMPGMNGPSLARTLLDERPHLQVIYMSGYTSDITLIHGVQAEQVEFLQKPFSQSQLLKRVQSVLREGVKTGNEAQSG